MNTAIGACAAALIAVERMHSRSPDAGLGAKIWFGLCGFSILLGIARYLYYRNRRDYFAEEMDHRRGLAKGTFRTRDDDADA